MKFKFITQKINDDDPENVKIDTVEYHFLRTLNTEKMYKDDTDNEFNMQIGELVSRLSKAEQDATNPEALAEVSSLNFIDTRHEVLKYMYAIEKDGVLIQNEKTREEFENLDLEDNQVFATFLSKLFGA